MTTLIELYRKKHEKIKQMPSSVIVSQIIEFSPL